MAYEVQEIEWQFDAVDLRPVERWLVGPERRAGVPTVEVGGGVSSRQVDLYLDTADWRFRRAGYTLRLRRVGRRRDAEATLAALDASVASKPGLSGRRDLCERLDAFDPGLLARCTGPVGERVRAVAGRKQLLPLFEVRTRRRLFVLSMDGLPPAELALDETAIKPPDGAAPARLRRVEIELPEATRAALAPFVERLATGCALRPATLSTYEAGLLSADLRPAKPERFGPTTVEPGMAVGAVAVAVLRRHFSVMLAKEPGTRLGDDIEELHEMRVATRRLRAALALFAEVLPNAAAGAREELGWIGRMLGGVRDLDVQIEQHEAWLGQVPEADRDALEVLGTLLREQRAEARTALLEALDSRRYEAFVNRFGRMLRNRQPRPTGPATLPALAVAPDLIERRFERVRAAGRRIGPESPAADYHRLRIHCKRLRYAFEFLTDLYPAATRPMLKRLVVLQDVLGLHQDADVAIDRLRRLAAERGGELGPATVFAMGEIAERYRNEMNRLRARFPPAYARVTGRRWRQFRALIENERPTPEPPTESPSNPAPAAKDPDSDGNGRPSGSPPPDQARKAS